MSTPAATEGSFRYKAFISYSHAADGKLAPALQRGLQQFCKPWYRLRAMRVFRDETGLAVTPELWGSIERALRQSEYFILLASPAAAQSRWVQQEVEFWLQHRDANRLLVVCTDGEIVWNSAENDFDWGRTNSLPRCLAKVFAQECNYGDLRWAKTDIDLSLRRPRFLDEIAKLTATLLHRTLEEIVGEDVAQHRTAMRMLGIGVSALLLLTLASAGAAYLSWQARRATVPLVADREAALRKEQILQREQETRRQEEELRHRNEAESERIAGKAAAVLGSDPELGTLLAIEAVNKARTPVAVRALRQTFVGLIPPLVLNAGRKSASAMASFTPDGKRVVTWTDAGALAVWDAQTGSNLFGVHLKKTRDESTHWSLRGISTNGSKIVALVVPQDPQIGNWDEGAVEVRDALSGQLLAQIQDPAAVDAAISPDGQQVVTVGFTTVVQAWDTRGNLRRQFPGHEQRVVSVDFSKDGRFVVSGSCDNTARVWNFQTGVSSVLRTSRSVEVAAFTPDGRVLTLGREKNTADELLLWDWEHNPEISAAKFIGRLGRIRDFDVSADGKLLATADGENTASIWDMASGKCLHVLRKHDEPVQGVNFSPDGQWVVTASLDRTARLWDVATGEELMPLGFNQAGRTGATFSPLGNRILTGTTEGQVFVYPCNICESVDELLIMARQRVKRQLSVAEADTYLRGR